MDDRNAPCLLSGRYIASWITREPYEVYVQSLRKEVSDRVNDTNWAWDWIYLPLQHDPTALMPSFRLSLTRLVKVSHRAFALAEDRQDSDWSCANPLLTTIRLNFLLAVVSLQLQETYSITHNKQDPVYRYDERGEGGMRATNPYATDGLGSNTTFVAPVRFRLMPTVITFEDAEPIQMLSLVGTICEF